MKKMQIEFAEIYVKSKWLKKEDFNNKFLSVFEQHYRSGKVHVVKFLRDMHSGKFPVTDDVLMDFMEAWLDGPALWEWQRKNAELSDLSEKVLKLATKEIDFEALKEFYGVTNLKDIK